MVLGDNGTGKTTLAQAFRWCLYGKTEFADESLVNKDALATSKRGQGLDVSVELEIIHRGTTYVIERALMCTVEKQGLLGRDVVKDFSITFKDDLGKSRPIPELELEAKIQELLPASMSRYFLFDGERIHSLSKQIQVGRKSKEFAEAVRGLLGLDPLVNALQHLDGSKNTTSVRKNFDKQYDASHNSRIEELALEIRHHEEELDKVGQEVSEQREVISELENEIRKEELNLGRFEEAARLQRQRKETMQRKDGYSKELSVELKAIPRNVSESSLGYFAKNLVGRAVQMFGELGDFDRGIPDIHARTLDFLLSQKKCLCGNDLLEGEQHFEAIRALKKFVPPESLGTSINHFLKIAESNLRTGEAFRTNFNETIVRIGTLREKISKEESELELIDQMLAGRDDVAHTQRHLTECRTDLKRVREENERTLVRKGQSESAFKRAREERAAISKGNEQNRKIEARQLYLKQCYKILSDVYSERESETRKSLEDEINSVFRKIFQVNLSIEIDENYGISVVIGDERLSERGVETSTAQSGSVILAFIAGIIALARRKSVEDSEPGLSLVGEPYPLIMDAPLSAFDSLRIEAFATVLPSVAEQVILFIKDVDGAIAVSHMKNKVGLSYRLRGLSAFSTTVEVQNV